MHRARGAALGLHFDHCGGSIRRTADGTGLEPAFPNAVYWSHEEHWEWATQPNAREKASFLSENILPIRESGQLKFTREGEELFPGFRVIGGHKLRKGTRETSRPSNFSGSPTRNGSLVSHE